MAPKRDKPPTYTPMPAVPEPLRERYLTMLAVLAGKITVSAGARRLGMSRNHFQSVMHRGLSGLLEGVSPKPPGRPKTPEQEALLSRENERLQRENERLAERVETIDRLLGVASEMLKGRIQPTRRSRSRQSTSRSATTTGSKGEASDDPEPRLRGAQQMRACGVRAGLCAAVAGVGASTLRRWSARQRAGLLLCSHARPRSRPPDPHAAEQVRQLVRQLRGLAGAESLRRSVPGVSRRQAAAIKQETLTVMERERIERAERVCITSPGVMRSFDAMYVSTTRGWRFPLVCGDASVPFRTSIELAERYDEWAVAAALERDFERHGAPLVLRLDRAACHKTERVRAVLRSHGVLELHGPPHHPGFYGQLERQNREHRAWLAHVGELDPSGLQRETERLRAALNGAWKRPTFGWRTATDVWNERPRVVEDRQQLREEVEHRAARIRRQNATRGVPEDLAMRLAIENALMNRGYLRREAGGWC